MTGLKNPVAEHLRELADQGTFTSADLRNAADEIDRLSEGWLKANLEASDLRQGRVTEPEVCAVKVVRDGVTVLCSAAKGHKILQIPGDKASGGWDHGNPEKGLYWRGEGMHREYYREPYFPTDFPERVPCGVEFEDSEDAVKPTCTFPQGHGPVGPPNEPPQEGWHGNAEAGVFWKNRVPTMRTYPTRQERDLAAELYDYLWEHGNHHRDDINVSEAADLIAKKILRGAPKLVPTPELPSDYQIRSDALFIATQWAGALHSTSTTGVQNLAKALIPFLKGETDA